MMLCVDSLHFLYTRFSFGVAPPQNTDRYFLQAGGSGPRMSPLPTKLLMSWEDIGTDHPDVPATILPNGTWLTQ